MICQSLVWTFKARDGGRVRAGLEQRPLQHDVHHHDHITIFDVDETVLRLLGGDLVQPYDCSRLRYRPRPF
jgi:hypothetical protein